MSAPKGGVPNDYVERDPDTVAIYQRHPNIRQRPLPDADDDQPEESDQ